MHLSSDGCSGQRGREEQTSRFQHNRFNTTNVLSTADAKHFETNLDLWDGRFGFIRPAEQRAKPPQALIDYLNSPINADGTSYDLVSNKERYLVSPFLQCLWPWKT